MEIALNIIEITNKTNPEAIYWNIPFWRIFERVFHEPYFMLYGEVYAFTIDSCLGAETDLYQCTTGYLLAEVLMVIFLLIANILLLYTFYPVFNSTYWIRPTIRIIKKSKIS